MNTRSRLTIILLSLYAAVTLLLAGTYWFTPYFDWIALSKSSERLCGLSQKLMGVPINAATGSSPDKPIAGWVQFCRYTVPTMTGKTYSPISKDEVLSYQVGNFLVTLPKNDIYSEYADKEKLDYYGKTIRTNRKNDNTVGSGCDRVDNLYKLFLEKSFPIPDNEGYFSRLQLSYYGWNTPSLIFDSEEDKRKALKGIAQLETLSDYENREVLRKKILNPKYDWGYFDPSDENNYPNVNIWSGYDTCAGIYSIPFMIKKLQSDFYDSAYYAEVSEGNGDTYSIPNRTLVLKKDNDWLIIKDEPQKPIDLIGLDGCPVGTLSHDARACIFDLWNSKYTDKTKSDQWIQTMLGQVRFNPN